MKLVIVSLRKTTPVIASLRSNLMQCSNIDCFVPMTYWVRGRPVRMQSERADGTSAYPVPSFTPV